MFRRSLAGVFLLAGCTPGVYGTVIVDDKFETYTDQSEFENVWQAVGTVAPLSGALVTTQAKSPTHSVHNPGTTTNAQSRNRRDVDETGTVAPNSSIVWSLNIYDSNPAGAPQRNHSNLHDGAANATNQLISMGFNNNQSGANSGGQFYMARILGYTVPTTADPDGGPAESLGGAGAFFKLNDFNVGSRSLGWHNLKVVISTDDGLSQDYAFYVDNVLAERVSNVGTTASMRSYDAILLGSGLSNGSVEVFWDDVYLENNVVPEPSSVAFLAAAGLLLGRRSRRAN